MCVPKYLWSDVVLSVCHLINKMPSSVLDEKNPFSYLYPNKSVFSMTSRAFSCTCFVQDLFPTSMKCVFIRYSRTQKEYRSYNSSTRKYFVCWCHILWVYSIFLSTVPITTSEIVPHSLFVSLPAPASIDSSIVPLADTSEPPASTPIRDIRYVYTHRQKISTCEPIPTNPFSVDSPLQPSTSPFDLDVLIALRKGKRSYTHHPLLNFVSNDHLHPAFRQFTLSLSSKSIGLVRRLY